MKLIKTYLAVQGEEGCSHESAWILNFNQWQWQKQAIKTDKNLDSSGYIQENILAFLWLMWHIHQCVHIYNFAKLRMQLDQPLIVPGSMNGGVTNQVLKPYCLHTSFVIPYTRQLQIQSTRGRAPRSLDSDLLCILQKESLMFLWRRWSGSDKRPTRCLSS